MIRHIDPTSDGGLGRLLTTLFWREVIEMGQHAVREKSAARGIDVAIAVSALLADEEAQRMD